MLYALQQAGRENADVVVADLDFLHTMAAALVRSMDVYGIYHVVDDSGCQLVEIQILLHLPDEAIHILRLFFLLIDFSFQLVDPRAQFSLLALVIIVLLPIRVGRRLFLRSSCTRAKVFTCIACGNPNSES